MPKFWWHSQYESGSECRFPSTYQISCNSDIVTPMAPYWHPPLILHCDFLCPCCSRKACAVCSTSPLKWWVTERYFWKSDEKIKIRTLIVSNLTNSKLWRFKFPKFYKIEKRKKKRAIEKQKWWKCEAKAWKFEGVCGKYEWKFL